MTRSKLYNHSVIQSFRIILSGNIATQLVGVLTYIVIARQYSTHDFGFSALFLSCGMILSIFHSGQTYLSMFSMHNQEELKNCYEDSILFLFKSSPLIILATILIYFSPFNKLDEAIFLLPLFSLTNSLIEINKNYSNAIGAYKDSVSQVFLTRLYGQVLKIILGAVKTNGMILVLCEFFANSYIGLKKSKPILGSLKGRWKFQIFSKYKKHILFYVPSNLANLLIQEFPVFLATFKFGLQASGTYFLLNRLIINPLTLVGNSFASSQIRKMNSYNQSPNHKAKFLLKSYLALLLIGFGPSIILFIWGDTLILALIGKKYEAVATLAKTLLFIIPFRVIKGMTVVSGVNADIYRSTLVIKLLLIILMIWISSLSMAYEEIIFYSLCMETIADILLGLLPILYFFNLSKKI